MMPNPSAFDLVDPLFNAIWNATKTWDVNSPEHYIGYCSLNGSHVMLILEALRATLPQAAREPTEADALDASRYRWLRHSYSGLFCSSSRDGSAVTFQPTLTQPSVFTPDKLDAAIDAARATERPAEGEKP